MSNYESIYKNTGTTPRTMNQAYKNAEYATPIYRHVNHEVRDAINFFGNMLVGAIYMALGVAIGIGILMFFGVVVIK